MSTGQLEKLPAELLVEVVNYVRSTRDLKALCLTSKAIRTIATPQLYRDVVLAAPSPSKLGAGILHANNAGLPFIRTLRVKDHGAWHGFARELIRRLLVLVPQNQLRSFDAEGLSFDEDTLITVLGHQSKLKRISLGYLMSNCTPLLTSGYLNDKIWDGLEELVVPGIIQNRDDLRFHQHIIHHAPKLRALSIFTTRARDTKFNKTLHGTSAPEGEIFATIFSHILRSGSPAKLQLEKLTERGKQPNQRHDETKALTLQQVLATAIDFSRLRDLQIDDCPGYACLLSELADLFKAQGSCLRSFKLEADRLEGIPLFKFLDCFHGLERLYLWARDEFEYFDSGCLYNHKDSLKEFAFATPESCDCEDHLEVTEIYPILRFARTCKKLEQCGLMLPFVDTSANGGNVGLLDTYNEAMAMLLSLPQLKLLRIFDWPQIPQTVFGTIKDIRGYSAEQQQAANRNRYLLPVHSFMHKLFKHMRLDRGIERWVPICFGGGRNQACDTEIHIDMPPVCYTYAYRYNVWKELVVETPTRRSLEEISQAYPDHGILSFME